MDNHSKEVRSYNMSKIRSTNSKPEELNGKYVRIDFYSKRDMYLGKKYIEVNNLEQNESMNFEAFFKLQEVDKKVYTLRTFESL